jgi:hypothetical protein
MKKTIKIAFKKFWSGFDYKDCLFYLLLSKHYDVEVTDILTEDIDILFVSCYGNEIIDDWVGTIKTVEICFENFYPNFNKFDYFIGTYNINNERSLRLPIYWYHSFYNVYQPYPFINEPNLTKDILQEKNNTIGMVISNSHRDGIEYLLKLMEKFDFKSGGNFHKNIEIGRKYSDKIELFKTCKFGIAFENSIHDDYITEKIYDCYLANVIPIYFGAKNINNDFNPESFINVHNYKNTDDLIQHIDYLMNNEDAYMDMLNKKRKLKWVDYTSRCEEFLINIIENGQIYNHIFGAIGWYHLGNIYRKKNNLI